MQGLLEGATGLLIDGLWEPVGTGLEVRDKYTRQPFSVVARAAPADVGRAVAGAARAAASPLPPAGGSHSWRGGPAARGAEGRDQRALHRRDGLYPADAATELARAVGTLRLSAEEAIRIAGEEVPVAATPGSENRLAFTIRVPVGVVVAITPFNAPLNTVAHKIGPAIAAGNAVVLKPAEQTPLSSMALARILLEAGLPPGPERGVRARRDHRAGWWRTRVRFITFTGSTAVGLAIKHHSGIAKTHLELGSNSASIVAADADLELVANSCRAGFRKAGQVCTCVQRVIADARCRRARGPAGKRVGALRAGRPPRPGSVGPLIAPAEAERAGSWIGRPPGGGACWPAATATARCSPRRCCTTRRRAARS